MNLRIFTTTLFLVLFSFGIRTGFCDSISNVELSPSRPAILTYGENIQITFSYSTNHKGGVRIWARPMSEGKRSPNYSASGSPLYSKRSGSGKGHFTIKKGNVLVDGIRFEIKTDKGKHLLYRTIVPVRYKFTKNPFEKVVAKKHEPYIRPDGIIELRKADGSAILITPEGRRGFRKANGEETWLFINLIPVEPPTQVTEAGTEWIKQLNKWLESVNEGMLNSIKNLADNPSSLQNYKRYEKAHCNSLYERVALRQKFLGQLVQKP
ncbi:MAG: hypothetical protein PVI71_05865 [Desulfobacterales bacterium]|jgi:hypothetical protein